MQRRAQFQDRTVNRFAIAGLLVSWAVAVAPIAIGHRPYDPAAIPELHSDGRGSGVIGHLRVAHSDSDEGAPLWHLQTEREILRILPVPGIDEQLYKIEPGSLVEIVGEVGAGSIRPLPFVPVFPIAPPQRQSLAYSNFGEQKVIALLSNFNNNLTQPLSTAQVVSMIANLSTFEIETSWNQASLTGTADVWRNIGIAQTCYYLDLLNNAIATFDPFVDFSQYTRILITYPPPAGGCGFAGQGTVGPWSIATADGTFDMSVSWIPTDYVDMRVMSHEFGHNFGVWHANGLACGPARAYSGMVYDPAVSEIVTYGGLHYGGRAARNIGFRSSQTWSFDPAAATWENTFAAAVPGDRSTGAMAHAGAGVGPVFFSGYTSPGVYDDKMFAYDSVTDTWRNLFPTTRPSARGYHAMANDTDGKLVLFGGHNGVAPLGDTWEYDPATNNWTQQNPTTPPSARYLITNNLAAIGGGKFIMMGGYNGAVGIADTWEYDIASHNWTQKSPSGTLPPATWAHSLVWDQFAKKIVMIFNSVTLRIYDPATNSWASASPSPNPGARSYHFATFDEITRRVMVFGGTSLAVNGAMWSYDTLGNAWTNRGSAFGLGTEGFSACYSAEYGNPWDSMGLEGPTHYDAEQKSIIGWLNESNSITAVNGTYDIRSIEEVPASEVQIVVPMGGGLHYSIEFRKAYGYDAGKSGNLYTGIIVSVGGTVTNGGDSHQVDMNLGSGTFDDGALAAGSTFVDGVNGIEIETISVNSTVARVRIGGTLDTTSPGIAIGYPPDGGSVWAQEVVTGTASDDIGVWFVDVQVNGGPWVRATGRSSWMANVSFATGPNTVCARATDTGGNVVTTFPCHTVTRVTVPELSASLLLQSVLLITLIFTVSTVSRKRGGVRRIQRG